MASCFAVQISNAFSYLSSASKSTPFAVGAAGFLSRPSRNRNRPLDDTVALNWALNRTQSNPSPASLGRRLTGVSLEPSVMLLVDRIVARSALRLATLHPSNPTSMVVRRAARRLVKRHRTALHHVLRIFDIDPDRIETVNPTRLSPHCEPRIQVRIAPNTEEAVAEAEACRDGIKVWTNGSLIAGGVGGTAVLEWNDEHKAIMRAHLGTDKEHIVFDGENMRLAMGLELARQERGVRRVSAFVELHTKDGCREQH